MLQVGKGLIPGGLNVIAFEARVAVDIEQAKLREEWLNLRVGERARTYSASRSEMSARGGREACTQPHTHGAST